MNLHAISIISLFVFHVKLIDASSDSCKKLPPDLPTGSVLFHEKKCWLHEDLVLLNTRKTMQNLIPTQTQDLSNDAYIMVMIDYFRMCFSTVQKMSCGRSQDILLLALADTIGGYLHYYLIPVTKRAFYAGNIRYEFVKKLLTFYEQIKEHLDTSGNLWAAPMDTSNVTIKVHKWTIQPPNKNEDPCCMLIVNESPGNCSKDLNLIPIPYMDDADKPTAIAVPFRAASLRKLDSPGGAFILEKYYMTSIQCMMCRPDAQEMLSNFNKKFYVWLMQMVIPRLQDDAFYPAFGGVMKILETMHQYINVSDIKISSKGGIVGSLLLPTTGDLDKAISHQDELETNQGGKVYIVEWSTLMAIGLGLIATGFCTCMLCACFRCKNSRICVTREGKRVDLEKNLDCPSVTKTKSGDSQHVYQTCVDFFYNSWSDKKKSPPSENDIKTHSVEDGATRQKSIEQVVYLASTAPPGFTKSERDVDQRSKAGNSRVNRSEPSVDTSRTQSYRRADSGSSSSISQESGEDSEEVTSRTTSSEESQSRGHSKQSKSEESKSRDRSSRSRSGNSKSQRSSGMSHESRRHSSNRSRDSDE